MSVELRVARTDDIGAMVEIEEASFSDPWSPDSFTAYLSPAAEGRALVTVAEDGERVVGYTVLLFALPDVDLANVAVAPASRGKGIGRLLLERALASARAAGAKHIFLEVRESNERAIRMYESAGFRAFAKRRRYYRDPTEDAEVLRLDLATP